MDVNDLFLQADAERRDRHLAFQQSRPASSQHDVSPGGKDVLHSGESQTMTRPAKLNDPIHLYRDKTQYRAATGRNADWRSIRDTRDFRTEAAAIDLRWEQPSKRDFMRIIQRELKIGGYGRKTFKSYMQVVSSFLRWHGVAPHQVTRESVKEYLLYLVDGDRDPNTVKVHLSAIRTVFDKFCFLDITLGLMTPRQAKKQSVILSVEEVRRLLESAISLRDKLLLGLMYATGMRVSEVVSVRWRDIDLDRDLISIVLGKGQVDRRVVLPESYRGLFASLKETHTGHEFLFPGEGTRGKAPGQRHISPRTVQRVMERTVKIAGIDKRATPHSLRHAFATHSYENGCDIRRIQRALGHSRLETTTIYVHLAKSQLGPMPSPLDSLTNVGKSNDDQRSGSTSESCRNQADQEEQRIGARVRLHAKHFDGEDCRRMTLQMLGRDGSPVFLTGTRVREPRQGVFTLELPPLETWRESMTDLSQADRELLMEPLFYEYLRRQATSLFSVNQDDHSTSRTNWLSNRIESRARQAPRALQNALAREKSGLRRSRRRAC